MVARTTGIACAAIYFSEVYQSSTLAILGTLCNQWQQMQAPKIALVLRSVYCRQSRTSKWDADRRKAMIAFEASGLRSLRERASIPN
jgi:hypothetical protein